MLPSSIYAVPNIPLNIPPPPPAQPPLVTPLPPQHMPPGIQLTMQHNPIPQWIPLSPGFHGQNTSHGGHGFGMTQGGQNRGHGNTYERYGGTPSLKM